jgi:hypothetical protein
MPAKNPLRDVVVAPTRADDDLVQIGLTWAPVGQRRSIAKP